MIELTTHDNYQAFLRFETSVNENGIQFRRYKYNELLLIAIGDLGQVEFVRLSLVARSFGLKTVGRTWVTALRRLVPRKGGSLDCC